jgi:hypothetical protein
MNKEYRLQRMKLRQVDYRSTSRVSEGPRNWLSYSPLMRWGYFPFVMLGALSLASEATVRGP